MAQIVGASAEPFPPAGGSWDLLVNATPVGMYPHVEATPWPDGPFDGHIVYDLIYNPLETRFLREAAAAGCLTIGGLDMLVAQAQEQAEWWTDIRPPARLLREAALGTLGLSEAAQSALTPAAVGTSEVECGERSGALGSPRAKPLGGVRGSPPSK